MESILSEYRFYRLHFPQMPVVCTRIQLRESQLTRSTDPNTPTTLAATRRHAAGSSAERHLAPRVADHAGVCVCLRGDRWTVACLGPVNVKREAFCKTTGSKLPMLNMPCCCRGSLSGPWAVPIRVISETDPPPPDPCGEEEIEDIVLSLCKEG